MLFKNINKLTNGYIFSFLSLLLLYSEVVAEGEVRITNVNDFKNFASDVNSGTNYSGTTVLLDSDLSLPGETLEPIGKNRANHFNSIFDGQGHIVSDLTINSTYYYTGLFGYSERLTIKNVVLDSSCSITSSFNSSNNVYAGGIIGYCHARYGQCNIENSVSMADVTFSGNTTGNSGNLYLGGIAGELDSSSSYTAYVKNCANYGSVTHAGSSDYSYIGGVVGWLSGYNYNYIYIYNCLNYGTITHSGTSSSFLYLGGIAGRSYYCAYIENCVSAGEISSTKTSSIRSIVGCVGSYTHINQCYYTSDLSKYKMYYGVTPASSSYVLRYDNSTFELSESVSVGSYTGTSLVDALNAYSDYYFLRDYSKWLLNKEKKGVNFTINSRTSPITMNYQIILLPSLASKGNISFDGWYNDVECTNPLISFEVTEDEELYGRFEENPNNYTISFDTRREGVFVAPITAQFGTVAILPSESFRDYCSIVWENEYGDDLGSNLAMPARNFTLYAVWKCTHLVTPDDFMDFSKVVNLGKDDFNGITVYLDSDLSLSDKILKPIGKNYYYFRGVFDGQGHIISDFKMNSTYYYTGLFGYSNGLTIRNVVLDSSCSITNSDDVVGGIIGGCTSSKKECNVENSVNMADVTFSGDIGSSNLVLGGIAGHLETFYDYPAYVKNCANYGSVTHSGTSVYSNIGGIAGDLYGSSSSYTYIYNSLNYGAIMFSGTTSGRLYLGGIAGNSYYAYIENCVSAGKISTQNIPEDNYIGSIVGYAYSYIAINYCYCTSELSEYDLYGSGTLESSSYVLSYDNTTFELGGTVSVGSYTGTSLIDALNTAADYYFLRDYSQWVLNKEEKSVTFTINSRTNPITMNYKIILLPSLASEGSFMFEWYNDIKCIIPLESFEITEDKTLYGRFEENTNNYTITFDTRKEDIPIAPITAQFGTVVQLPSESIREHCSVAFWETEYGDDVGLSLTMPARNFTLYAVWKCTHLVTPDDFIDFSKVVNLGKDDFNGITVYLDSDLSLSDKILKPIGDYFNYYYYFRGVFDGQGHIISDLKMNSSLKCAGLFGYSSGLTIKNVVLDSSCSITSSFRGFGWACVGGIIGYCQTYSGQCNIENSVNMADVTFNGNTSYTSFLGGVAGYLSTSSSYPSYAKNCANYGSVAHSGTSEDSYIGGIVGYLYGSSYKYIYNCNCLNHGTITHSGTTSDALFIGGIVGRSSSTYIVNCVSAGKIFTQNTPSESYIGSIVGQVYSYTSINNCYYTSDVGDYDVNGTGTPINTTGTPDSPTSVESTLISELNDYASNNGWNKWLLNANNVSITFKVNDNAGFTVNSQIILLPDLVDNGERSFSGWYADATLTLPFTGNELNIETTLYGMFCGSSNYTVTFDVNGGNALSVTAIMVAFNSTYGTLPEAEKPGYMFLGWFTEKTDGTMITSETIVTIPNNHTLYAHWEEITNQVEVVFSKKDLTKSEAEETLKQYTKAEFTIVKYEINELGEIIVIVKFTNKEDAEKFVGAINELGGNGDIKRTIFVFSSDNESFSLKLYPTLLPIVMLLL